MDSLPPDARALLDEMRAALAALPVYPRCACGQYLTFGEGGDTHRPEVCGPFPLRRRLGDPPLRLAIPLDSNVFAVRFGRR
jgi:hypothetical protein